MINKNKKRIKNRKLSKFITRLGLGSCLLFATGCNKSVNGYGLKEDKEDLTIRKPGRLEILAKNKLTNKNNEHKQNNLLLYLRLLTQKDDLEQVRYIARLLGNDINEKDTILD